LLEVLGCLFLMFIEFWWLGAYGIAGSLTDEPTGLFKPRDPSKKCEFDKCRSLSYRSTDYCWKHQGGKPHDSDYTNWWESKD